MRIDEKTFRQIKCAARKRDRDGSGFGRVIAGKFQRRLNGFSVVRCVAAVCAEVLRRDGRSAAHGDFHPGRCAFGFIVAFVGNKASYLVFFFHLRQCFDGEGVSCFTAEAAEDLRVNRKPALGGKVIILPLIGQSTAVCLHVKNGVAVYLGGYIRRVLGQCHGGKYRHDDLLGIDTASGSVSDQTAVSEAVTSLGSGNCERVGAAALVRGYAHPLAAFGSFQLLPLIAQFLAAGCHME